MMPKLDNCIIAIFGGSGDLAKRKLVPALFNLYQDGLLPDKFAILGFGRQMYSDDLFRQNMIESIRQHGRQMSLEKHTLQRFVSYLFYNQLEMENPHAYNQVALRLKQIDLELGIGGNYLHYLATPPELFAPIALNLAEQGLQQQMSGSCWKRLIVEKPFGHDLKSAQQLNSQLLSIFAENQIFRIDHYLGKETVQNILAFRFANGIFEPLWNRNFVHHVEITAAESIGVQDRGDYYDHAGALRDMVQNHLLQITATIAMEPPALFEPNSIRSEKVKIFQSLAPIKSTDVARQVVRGQYIQSTIRGEKVTGYRQENNVASDSRSETFVALKFFIDNWRWGGIPFYIRTGKRMPTRVTEVVIHFKKTPHSLFRDTLGENSTENQLILRIQPDEGILLKFGMKVPGAGYNIKTVGMDFHYSDLTDAAIPEAYERLLLDALMGDNTLYARADGVEAAWTFIDPILQAWATDPQIKMYGYPAGSWGPKQARVLLVDSGVDWRYPCKNLTGDDLYCEL